MVTGVALLTDPAVTVNVTELEPCRTVTEDGMEIAEPDFERVTVAPPVGAAAVNARVAVADWPLVIAVGATVRRLKAAGMGLTVSAALELAPP